MRYSVDRTGHRSHYVIHAGDKGLQVKHLQALLTHNRWGERFYHGPVDGEYGPLTLAAVREARYRLGYPKTSVAHSAVGEQLISYLVPLQDHARRRLPTAWWARRIARHRHRLKPLRLRRYAIAARHLGYHEGAGNETIFGKWYGLDGQPWCAMFLSFCDVMAGGRFRYAYTPAISEDAYYGRNGLHRTYSPKRGDGCTFDWQMRHSVSGTDHVGQFDRWLDRHGNFLTIEGNTGPQSGYGTEGVYRRTRNTSEVVVFFTMP